MTLELKYFLVLNNKSPFASEFKYVSVQYCLKINAISTQVSNVKNFSEARKRHDKIYLFNDQK